MESDLELLDRLRGGDEQAFVTIVGRYHDSMLRLARSYVPSLAVAEEVVQDTWMGVLRGISGFEGRSTFKTWLFHILVNRARSTGTTEHVKGAKSGGEATVDPRRFDSTGHWSDPPHSWTDDSDDRMFAGSLTKQLKTALEELSPLQLNVVILRDVEGLTSMEVSTVLEITEGNQRVLLHRARSRLRSLLEKNFREA